MMKMYKQRHIHISV